MGPIAFFFIFEHSRSTVYNYCIRVKLVFTKRKSSRKCLRAGNGKLLFFFFTPVKPNILEVLYTLATFCRHNIKRLIYAPRPQVRLRSADPFAKPVIRSNFFTEPADLHRLVEGIKMAVRLADTRAFQKFRSTVHRTPMLGCRHLEFGTDAYWACCVQTMTMQMHHQAGTCKMGPAHDRNAVVSPELRVYGVSRLRVIDCSVMPTITGAHTMAPTYMIGEKGADLVKSAWANGTVLPWKI